MLGTPARLLMAMRTALTTAPAFAYSRRYSAASTPKGTTAIDIRSVITMVPTMAGNTPPSLLASRGSPARNSFHRDRRGVSFGRRHHQLIARVLLVERAHLVFQRGAPRIHGALFALEDRTRL